MLLVLIICLLIGITTYRYDASITLEPFDAYLSACPAGFSTFYESNGDVMCCKGDVVGKQCLSDSVCTLGAESPTIPRCVEYVKQMHQEKGAQECPPSMTSYFESNERSGCTSGPLLDNMTGPRQTSQPTCVIYKTQLENERYLDSCFLMKELEQTRCFGKDCSKRLTGQDGHPALVELAFTDSSNIPRHAITRASLTRSFLSDKKNQNGLSDESRQLLKKSVIVAEVAKAYFVDKTLQDSDIILGR